MSSITTIKNKNNHTPLPSDAFTLFTYSQLCSIEDVDDNKIKNGLDFTLSHFEEPLFPRMISTYKSQINKPYQFPVSSKEEITNAFADSNFVDCRINAYPCLTDYKDVPRYKPDLLFIDLDRNDPRFKNRIDRSFQNALYNTLKNIKEKLNGNPTILETGGGYHIYQPVYCPTALENIIEFNNFDRPSEQFLRFAKDNLSNGKSDKQNNPSFRSCLLRIPGSINSKYGNKVRIVQKWNGHRPLISRDFIEEFRIYLIQKKIDLENKRHKMINERIKNNTHNINSSYYEWIDQLLLLKIPIEDFRKLVVDLVLAPYLINIKKLSYSDSYQIIKDWLDKCNDLKRLDNYRNFVEYRIPYALKNAMNKQIGPMSREKIKTDTNYNELYQILKEKKVLL